METITKQTKDKEENIEEYDIQEDIYDLALQIYKKLNG